MKPSENCWKILTNEFPSNIRPFLEAIPKDWKDLLNTEMGKPDETFYIQLDSDIEPKLVTKLNCKILYNTLLRRDTGSVDHAYRQKWANTLGSVNWGKVFKNIQKSNMIVKQTISDGKFYIDAYLLLED